MKIAPSVRMLWMLGEIVPQETWIDAPYEAVSSKHKACRVAARMADVLKNTLVPEASALELVLRPAVEEQEILASLFMVDDKRVSAAHPLPLPVEAITDELVHILLAIGLLVFGYEEPNLTSLPEDERRRYLE